MSRHCDDPPATQPVRIGCNKIRTWWWLRNRHRWEYVLLEFGLRDATPSPVRRHAWRCALCGQVVLNPDCPGHLAWQDTQL